MGKQQQYKQKNAVLVARLCVREPNFPVSEPTFQNPGGMFFGAIFFGGGGGRNEPIRGL